MMSIIYKNLLQITLCCGNIFAFDICWCGEMADARDSKSREGNFMWVRLPPPAPKIFICGILSPYGTSTPVGARPHFAYANVLPALAKNNHTGLFFLRVAPARATSCGFDSHHQHKIKPP